MTTGDPPAIVDGDWAFARYEAIRDRLVDASFPRASECVSDLEAVADRFEAFVLDAFGVLNVGETAIDGAIDRIRRLRRLGKRLVVLTNSATHSRAQALAKYHRLGFDFTADEVVASRDLAAAALADLKAPGALWAAASAPDPDFADLGALRLADLLADDRLYDAAAGFVLFSSAGWTRARQDRLLRALERRPRPLVVANPDLVAPRETGFSLEPGYFAHAIWDRLGQEPRFYGKPYGNAFAAAHRLIGLHFAPEDIAMVGDTLHTDILGGRAAGFGTILASDHGLFRGRDIGPYIERSGIVPDIILPQI